MTLSIEELAQTRTLLVVSDFDGTIAGFSKDAYQVPINQKSLKAIKDLSNQANTDVVILSGRHLEGLNKVLDLGDYPITKVGSQAWTVGAKVYWDDTNKRCTTVATDNTLIGAAVEAVVGAAVVVGAVLVVDRPEGRPPSSPLPLQAASTAAQSATITHVVVQLARLTGSSPPGSLQRPRVSAVVAAPPAPGCRGGRRRPGASRPSGR